MKAIQAFAFLLFLLPLLAFAKAVPFSIYHSNDLHSHLEGVKKPGGAGDLRQGGFARLATSISQLRAEKLSRGEIIFGVDAGDFFAGTVFSALAPSEQSSFPEYEFLSQNNYSAATLGNHEFDAGNAGLEIMLEKAAKLANGSPLVASNLVLKPGSRLSRFVGPQALIKPYVIQDFTSAHGNLRVAFLGALGPDGCAVSRATRGDVQFIGYNEDKAKKNLKALADHLNSQIEKLRTKDGVQVVILSMHGGGEEAANLVKKLKGLDVLIAGHTHTVQFETVGTTLISQTGSYGENLGFLQLQYDTETKRVSLQNPNAQPHIPMGRHIQPHPEWTQKIIDWKIQAGALMGFQPGELDQVVFTPQQDYLWAKAAPNTIGTLITDTIVAELNRESAAVDLYMTTNGLIRGSFYKGVPYTRADVFEILSIGFDQQLLPGDETVSFYLTVQEVIRLVNFMEFYSKISENFQPVYSSDISFKIEKLGIPFINRIQDLRLRGRKLSDLPKKQLLKVATNRTISDNLAVISSSTHGLVRIDPKDKNGNSNRDYEVYSKEFELLTRGLLRKP